MKDYIKEYYSTTDNIDDYNVKAKIDVIDEIISSLLIVDPSYFESDKIRFRCIHCPSVTYVGPKGLEYCKSKEFWKFNWDNPYKEKYVEIETGLYQNTSKSGLNILNIDEQDGLWFRYGYDDQLNYWHSCKLLYSEILKVFDCIIDKYKNKDVITVKNKFKTIINILETRYNLGSIDKLNPDIFENDIFEHISTWVGDYNERNVLAVKTINEFIKNPGYIHAIDVYPGDGLSTKRDQKDCICKYKMMLKLHPIHDKHYPTETDSDCDIYIIYAKWKDDKIDMSDSEIINNTYLYVKNRPLWYGMKKNDNNVQFLKLLDFDIDVNEYIRAVRKILTKFNIYFASKINLIQSVMLNPEKYTVQDFTHNLYNIDYSIYEDYVHPCNLDTITDLTELEKLKNTTNGEIKPIEDDPHMEIDWKKFIKVCKETEEMMN